MIKINGVILFRSSGQPTDAVHAIATMAQAPAAPRYKTSDYKVFQRLVWAKVAYTRSIGPRGGDRYCLTDLGDELAAATAQGHDATLAYLVLRELSA